MCVCASVFIQKKTVFSVLTCRIPPTSSCQSKTKSNLSHSLITILFDTHTHTTLSYSLSTFPLPGGLQRCLVMQKKTLIEVKTTFLQKPPCRTLGCLLLFFYPVGSNPDVIERTLLGYTTYHEARGAAKSQQMISSKSLTITKILCCLHKKTHLRSLKIVLVSSF